MYCYPLFTHHKRRALINTTWTSKPSRGLFLCKPSPRVIEVESWECKNEEPWRREGLTNEEFGSCIFSPAKTNRREMPLVDQWARPIVDSGGIRKRRFGPRASELIVLSYWKSQGSRDYCEVERSIRPISEDKRSVRDRE